MYRITQDDFCRIRQEAAFPDGEGEAYAVTFSVMEQIFPPFLYARRSTFACAEDLEDCLSAAEMRVIERIQRRYFEREDMEKDPESLQKWMITVLKNVYFSSLRRTVTGRETVQRMIDRTAAEWGTAQTGDGAWDFSTLPADSPALDGGFADLYREETRGEMRCVLRRCFEEIFDSRAEPQIVLAWLTVSAMILHRDMKKKDAITLLAQIDPTMGDLFGILYRMMKELDWLELRDEDFNGLKQKLDALRRDGKKLADMRFGDFTDQSAKAYISKSIHKRNDSLRRAGSDDFDF